MDGRLRMVLYLERDSKENSIENGVNLRIDKSKGAIFGGIWSGA